MTVVAGPNQRLICTNDNQQLNNSNKKYYDVEVFNEMIIKKIAQKIRIFQKTFLTVRHEDKIK